VNAYDFIEWRSFVRAALAERGWHQRDLARALPMSPANLSVLLSSQRRLSAEWVGPFAAALALDDAARSWFAALVDLESPSERARLAAVAHVRSTLALRSSPSPEQEVVDAQADWRVNVVQELASCDGFRPDPTWMARVLTPDTSPAEAAEAWQRVLRTGLVEARDDGTFSVRSVRTPPVLQPSATVASWRFQRSVFDLATDAWTRFATNERHGGVTTMAVSEDVAAVVLRRLRELEQELVQLAAEDPGPRNRVYLLTTQLFPVTDYTDWEPDAP
jgi:uncharacterized protein (TIGR02147 family)